MPTSIQTTPNLRRAGRPRPAAEHPSERRVRAVFTRTAEVLVDCAGTPADQVDEAAGGQTSRRSAAQRDSS